MTDTPKHIHDLQLKIWLAKSPQERFLQFITDNDMMFKAIIEAKQKLQSSKIKIDKYPEQ